MDVRSCRIDLVDAIAVSQGDLTLIVVPELGGKICSITWQQREILARNELRPAWYEAPYSDFDASGFDECLPSIGQCNYPVSPWVGTAIPDHGEIWSIPSSFEADGNRVKLKTHGVRFPYEFEKAISLGEEGQISIQYQLTNPAPFPFPFLWSAHPLLAIQPGWRIHLPAGVKVLVDWSRDERLGEPFTEHLWPEVHAQNGQSVDLSLILDQGAGTVEKLYTSRLDEGWCALRDPVEGFYVAMLFDSEKIPFVGLSINLGGWPVEGPGYFNLGLEPCNGFPDRLDLALERGAFAVAPPFGQVSWWFDLCVGTCANMLAEIDRLHVLRAIA